MWLRQLPSGKWAATVRTPAGRITESHESKTVIKRWANDLETDAARGDFIDPRAGDITVGEWWERCRDSRHLEKATRKRHESQWRRHIAPRWANVRIGSILHIDVAAWVVRMREAGVGAATIEGAACVLIGLLDLAVASRIRRDNPAKGVSRPRPSAHVDRVLDADEETLLLERLDDLFPGRPDGRLFVELLLDTGMRWEEAAAVPRGLVDTRRRRADVRFVMERDGTIRDYTKSGAGTRTVPISDGLMARLRPHLLTVVSGANPVKDPACLVFQGAGPAHEDGCKRRGCSGCKTSVLRYATWRARVWRPALLGPDGSPLLDDPQPTPHDCRHTFGTRLADEGVPLHDIMRLMGHGDMRSVQRYMHSGEERFDRARRALDAARGVDVRVSDGRAG
jgi:integrase